MAGNEDRKAELIAQLARARQEIDSSGANVRRDLDVPARIRSNFQRHPVAWLGGGLAAGLLVVALIRRPRPASRKERKAAAETVQKAGAAGLLLAGGKIAFEVLRPVLVKWLVSRAAPLAEKMVARYTSRSDSPRGDWDEH